MAASPDRASRLRKKLLAHFADYQKRLNELLPIRQLARGSVYELKTRCGKPTCHCASDDGPLHSQTVLSWSQDGKTRLQSLPAGEQAHFRQLTENYRLFRQARAALVKLHRQMLLAVDNLEQALLLPPPKPAARKKKKKS